MGISESTEDDQAKAAFRHVEQYLEGFNCPLPTMLLFLLRTGCDLESTDNDGRSSGELGFKGGQQQKRTGSSLYQIFILRCEPENSSGSTPVPCTGRHTYSQYTRYARTSGLSGGIRVEGGFREGRTDRRFKGSFYSSFISDKRELLHA